MGKTVGHPGLEYDMPDIVEYRHGYSEGGGVWQMSESDIDYLNNLAVRLNLGV